MTSLRGLKLDAALHGAGSIAWCPSSCEPEAVCAMGRRVVALGPFRVSQRPRRSPDCTEDHMQHLCWKTLDVHMEIFVPSLRL